MDTQGRGNKEGHGDHGMREYNRSWKIMDSWAKMS